MFTGVKLTNQESDVVRYLEVRSGREVAWEELVQFSKTPSTVKLKTMQKVVSDIKRKFALAGTSLPFNVKFITLVKPPTPPVASQQNLIQVKRTPSGNVIPVNNNKHQVQIDFELDPMGFKRVKTRSGVYQLNDSEWDMFKYFYNNPGKLITISELRDKLMYPNYGSKLPARWFDAIMRVVNNLRRQVYGLDKRLLTVKGTETSYLFQ
jgi:hypothetical protein